MKKSVEIRIIWGVHGSGWVRLKGFFYPTHMGRVELMGWTIFFITIIIKLSRKKYIIFAT